MGRGNPTELTNLIPLVVGAGVQRTPTATAGNGGQGPLEAMGDLISGGDGETGQSVNPFLRWLGNGALTSVVAFGSLQAGE